MVAEPVQEIIRENKVYFYGTAFFYAFFITFCTLLSGMLLAYLIYGLRLTSALWILLPLFAYVFIQVSNGFFLFTITYVSALILEHKEVTLQDSKYIVKHFFVETLKIPFFILSKRDTLRRYLSYPHAIFSDKKIFEAYEDAEKLRKAIDGGYPMLNIPLLVGYVAITGIYYLLLYLLPLNPYTVLTVATAWIFTMSFAGLISRVPKLIERTALYIYSKAGRILSPFTFEDLKESIT